MITKIIGIENVEFKIDDEEFKGQNLYCTYNNKYINGLGCLKVFANNGNYNINDSIEVSYSKTFKKLYVKK